MPNVDVLRMTISELSPKIQNKEISPLEATEAALMEAARLQPTLNSFITLMYESAMEQARESEQALVRGEYRGPLHGVPIGLKDNLATAGVTTTVGSKVLANYVPEEDAEVVVRCRNAGAIIIGKENLEEFAAGATSNNPHYGAVHNPWGLDHVPGGSSGGGGANVAAGITFASLGTDLGGSVRLPGTFCGVVGLKQTYGRVSQRGLMVTSFNGDHIGPMTRSVADSALMLQVLAGNDPLDPSTVPVAVPDYNSFIGKGIKGLKMGVPSNHFFDMLDSDVETAVRASIASLEELGADLQDVNLPTMEYIGAMRISAMADGVVTHEEFLKNHRGDYGPDVFYRTIPGQFVLGRDYSKSLKVQRLIQEEYLRVMQQVDFLVTPTAPVPAPRIDATYIDINGENHRVRGAGSGFISRNTSPLNAVGLPAISVPCGTNRAGLPIGVQFISGPFNEGLLFQVADSYEKVSPSQGLCPLVSVGQ